MTTDNYPAIRLTLDIMNKEDGNLISQEQGEALLDEIIDLVESKGLCLAGGLSPVEE